MGHDLDALALRTGVEMAAQRRRPAGDNLAHRLEDHGADPLPGRAHKLSPVSLEARRNPVPDLGTNRECIRARRYLLTHPPSHQSVMPRAAAKVCARQRAKFFCGSGGLESE